ISPRRVLDILSRGGTGPYPSSEWARSKVLVDTAFRSADQKVSPQADSREHSDTQHHLLMPAHPGLGFADCQGTHNRHRGLLGDVCATYLCPSGSMDGRIRRDQGGTVALSTCVVRR